jgi:polysaccharide deacetylase 2 family uncharacterized protein YibQ
VFVFDDGGQNLADLAPFLALPFPVTVAVLPGLRSSAASAEAVRRAGKELILHQPMQAKNPAVNPGPGAIRPGMGREEVRRILGANIAELAPIRGMNNHEGSLVTESRELMRNVLELCVDEGLYFLDSRTTADTEAPAAAAALGMTIWERNVFLDNDAAEEAILAELRRGLAIANRDGRAILIGHVWSPQLAPLLQRLHPLLATAGYTFTTISTQ